MTMIRIRDLWIAPAINSRKTASSLEELTEDIRKNGLISPPAIVAITPEVRSYAQIPWTSHATHLLVAGFRRTAAYTEVWGVDGEMEVTIKEWSSAREIFALNVRENVQREDLHPLDLAEALAHLRELGVPQKELASEIKKAWTDQHVAKYLRLADNLHPRIKDAWRLRHGSLSFNACDDFAREPLDQQNELWEGYLKHGRIQKIRLKKVADAGETVRRPGPKKTEALLRALNEECFPGKGPKWILGARTALFWVLGKGKFPAPKLPESVLAPAKGKKRKVA